MPYSYLKIAEELAGAGRHGDAPRWAEDGDRIFAERRKHDQRLVDFPVDERHRRGRHRDALELCWASFERSPLSLP